MTPGRDAGCTGLLLCIDADERGRPWSGGCQSRRRARCSRTSPHRSFRHRSRSRRTSRHGFHRGLSRAVPDPTAWTLLRFSVPVIVAGAANAAQLNEVPSGQTARYCTLAVPSPPCRARRTSRVLRTSSVACTVEPSAHGCGTAQKASAVSSKKSSLSAVAVATNAVDAANAASTTTSRRTAAWKMLW